jgi:carboxyl-terminal processing protease
MVKIVLAIWLILAWLAVHAEDTLTQPTDVNPKTIERLPLKELRLFTQVFEQVRTGYIEELSDSQLFDRAIEGLLENLDPHSIYLNEEDYQELQEDTSGDYGGVGMEVTTDQGLILVVTPLDNSPAAEAGIKAGDYIVEIDGQSVRGIGLQKATELLRGEKGTMVSIGLLRSEQTEIKNLTLERKIIHINSVRSRILEEGYGYIRIAQFQSDSGNEFKSALDELQAEGPLQGLILDLRNNPGGLLPESIAIADTLLDQGLIVYTEGRLPNANIEYQATSGDLLNGAPIAVIINGGSASASEIVAGALQDQGRAIILGNRSFGKGSVQTLMPLGDGRAIKLTTANYFTPSGRSIHGEGIEPDSLVEPTEEGAENSHDLQLKAAIDWLNDLQSSD